MIIVLVFAASCSKKDPGGMPARPVTADASVLPGSPTVVVIQAESPQLKQLHVESVLAASMPGDSVIAPGRIEFDPGRVSRIILPVPGRIVDVFVRIGDQVTAGQVLFALDSPDADAALSEFRQSQAAVSQARSALIKAQADRDRAAELFDHKAIAQKDLLASENELVQVQAALDQTEAAREHCRRRLEILGLVEGDGEKRVMVKAPLSGKVIDVAITRGEYRNDTTTSVMTVADLGTVWVTSSVPENAIRLIEVGESVEVELVAFPGEIFSARVKRIADTLDPKTRAVQVRAELANPQGKFRPEMFGTIRHSHASQSVPVVPARAVLRRGGKSFVYVEREPGTFERVPVVLGTPSGDRVPVLKGVAIGDRVVVDGVMLLAGVEVR
jgi:cobalt-zinc-cadmium efflux system membrane fusion protein